MAPVLPTTKVITVCLHKCCTEKGLSTAPWFFLLIFHFFPLSSSLLQKGEKLMKKALIDCHSFWLFTQKTAACTLNIIIKHPLSKRDDVFRCFSTVLCYNADVLPLKAHMHNITAYKKSLKGRRFCNLISSISGVAKGGPGQARACPILSAYST